VLSDPNASEKEKAKVEADEVAVVESGVCLTAVTESAKSTYCGHKYLPQFYGAYVNCAGPNFCDVCCSAETINPEENKTKLKSCKDSCHNNSDI
jgi:hypothetical protein